MANETNKYMKNETEKVKKKNEKMRYLHQFWNNFKVEKV